MVDFDFGNTSHPQNEEDFQPGVTITPHGVSLFAANFRSEALRQGLVVDVSEMAAEVGFTFSVAVTKTLWDDVRTIPEAYSHEDEEGRLWDVLYMAILAIRQSPPEGAEVRYNVILHTDQHSGDSNPYPVRLVCHGGDAGEPVITLSNPEKDIQVELGEIVMTPGALDAFVSANASPSAYLARHLHGDWGQVGEEDWSTNNRSARDGDRLLSSYTLPATDTNPATKIWVITEWDRSVTTLLLPSEY